MSFLFQSSHVLFFKIAFSLRMVLICCLRSFGDLKGEHCSPEMFDHEGLEAVVASAGRGYVASDVFLTFPDVTR